MAREVADGMAYTDFAMIYICGKKFKSQLRLGYEHRYSEPVFLLLFDSLGCYAVAVVAQLCFICNI